MSSMRWIRVTWLPSLAALAMPLVALADTPVVQPLPGVPSSGPAPAAVSQPVVQPMVADPEASAWDRARAALAAQPSGPMAYRIERWRQLIATGSFGFTDYASFLLANPGFPEEARLRSYAERALAVDSADPARIVAFFDRFPPQTNPARARYALALLALRRADATDQALKAWRGGDMADDVEAAIGSALAGRLTPADQDARMNALLWAGATAAAQRQSALVSPAAAPSLLARLAMLSGQDPLATGLPAGPAQLTDPGWLYNRSRMLRGAGRMSEAVSLLASHPPIAAPPLDPRKWIGELLTVAQGAGADGAAQIAATIDQAFPAGTDVSQQSFPIRDDYTSLMWLGGTKALWSLGDGTRAAQLFYRYGAAAQTPQTRSKGFYWAGRALAKAGDQGGAARYLQMAAAYPDQFYGMLADERLGQPLPSFATRPTQNPTAEQRLAFNAAPLTQAVREVARESDWPTAVRFFREISNQAVTEAQHVLVADLARQLGRRDLAVINSQSAAADGHNDFASSGFPTLPAPPGTDWTMVHAISRQESQFAMNAVSHAGARGLMQLMPRTASEQAGKLMLSYDAQSLTTDAGYNLQLGDAYFARMMDYFGGSYPLAVAAYNAGAGNVNKWLRTNGDPRTGAVDWIDWIERIPLSETRGYVQHVLENAVVYDAMNPDKASYKGANPLSHFLGKTTPG